MRIFAFILSAIFCTTHSFCQIRINPIPTDLNSAVAIKKNHIKKESIYSYSREEKNRDSMLMIVKFFDENGFCIEKDELDKKGKIYSTTSFQYLDDKLIKEENATTTLLGNTITTYNYDSNGNKIEERIYNADTPHNLIRRASFTYDNQNRLTDFFNYKKDNIFLHTAYSYFDDNEVKEIRTSDSQDKWLYSYLYEFDSLTNTKNEYWNEESKRLVNQFFYNPEHQLIKIFKYNYASFHSTNYFAYNNDLLFFEKVELTTGDKFYFKHYYYQ